MTSNDNRLQTPLLATALTIVLSASLLTGCTGQRIAPTSAQSTSIVQTLDKGRWDAFNRQQINALIATHGKTSPSYNATRPPYAVFDWDDTSIFLDIQNAVLIYQLQNLRFAATPEVLDMVLRKNVPRQAFNASFNNAAGKPISINQIAPDIVESYRWLYQNYIGLRGSQSLEEVKKSPHYQNFITKIRYLYDAIFNSFGEGEHFLWSIKFLFVGMTEAQVRQLTNDAVRWQLSQPIEEVQWTSPTTLSRRSGVVSVKWKNGLRLVPEMQDLYAKLRHAGFDVWICSASFLDTLKEISSNPIFGYNNPIDHILAIDLERSSQGVIQPEHRRDFPQTYRKGKTHRIQHALVQRYGYGPVFIAGDSEGDQHMMQDFPDTQTVLIINRLHNDDIGKLSAQAVRSYGQNGAKYLLQGRDDNTGTFLPSQMHRPLGISEAQLLAPPPESSNSVTFAQQQVGNPKMKKRPHNYVLTPK